MATIIHTVKLVAETKDATEAIKQFSQGLYGVERSVASLERSLQGTAGLKRAQEWTIAMGRLGGATGDVVTKEQLLAGASKLTAAEKVRLNRTITEAIEKYRVLGQAAPAAMLEAAAATKVAEKSTSTLSATWAKFGPMLAATFGVGAITGAIRSTVQWADDLTEVAAGLGMNVERLQQLEFAWGVTGSSVESGIKAIQTMQDKLGGNDKSAIAAVEKLGLNFYRLKSLAPEEQFDVITEALRGLTDQTSFATIGADLFGKMWKSVSISVKNGMKEMADSAPHLTQKEIEDIGRLKDMYDSFIMAAKVAASRAVIGSTSTGVPRAPFFAPSYTNQQLDQPQYDYLSNMPPLPGAPKPRIGAEVPIPGVSQAMWDAMASGKLERLKATWLYLKEWTPEIVEGMVEFEATGREITNVLMGLTKDGLIPVSTSFSDLVQEVPDYTKALDEAHEYTQTLRWSSGEAAKAMHSWRSELGSLAAAFQMFAQTSGTGGLADVAKQIANIVGSLELAAKASDKLAQSLAGKGPDGRILTDGERWASAASSILQFSAAMSQAAQSTNHLMNALGGAATGASMGSNPALMWATGGLSMPLGALAGGLMGFFKGTPQDDVTQQMKDQWAAQYGGWESFNRLVVLAGANTRDFNLALKAGKDDLREYNNAITSVNKVISDYQARLAAYQKGGAGVKTLADAIGLGTSQAQFDRLGQYTSILFGQMLRETGSLAEALMLVSDTLDSILANSQKYNLVITGPIAELLNFRGFLTGNPDLAARITGLGQLGSMGSVLKSSGMMGGFGSDLAELFRDIMSRGGIGQDQALLLMQGPLQQLWELAKTDRLRAGLGQDVLDLLKLAESKGLVGEDMKNVAERQLDVLSQIRDLLAGVPSAESDYIVGVPGGRYNPDRLRGRDVAETMISAGGETVIQVPVNLDGREVANVTARYLPAAVSRYGVH